MKKHSLVLFLAVAILIPLLTLLVIKFAKGYTFNFSKKQFEPRGILVATSTPDGAQVFINGKLETATNNTLPLPPGTYKVEIKKDGFASWSKELKIEKELVTKTDAFLFRTATDLRPITFSGAYNPSLSPDGTKLVYSLPASESGRGGLWIDDLIELPFGLSRGARQMVQSLPKGRDLTKAKLSWSSDSRQLIISFGKENFLIETGQTISETSLIDITPRLKLIKADWQVEENRILEAKLKRLPKGLPPVLKNAAVGFNFSPDGEKLLYQATASAQIPKKLVPPLPAVSTQKEEREIKTGRWYIYDLNEDKNFFIFEAIHEVEGKPIPKPKSETSTPQAIIPLGWLPTSRHLIIVEKEKISLVEYDGTNKTTVFAAPFENSFVFSSPNANKIIVLTSFGQEENQPPNLYSINLR